MNLILDFNENRKQKQKQQVQKQIAGYWLGALSEQSSAIACSSVELMTLRSLSASYPIFFFTAPSKYLYTSQCTVRRTIESESRLLHSESPKIMINFIAVETKGYEVGDDKNKHK